MHSFIYSFRSGHIFRTYTYVCMWTQQSNETTGYCIISC